MTWACEPGRLGACGNLDEEKQGGTRNKDRLWQHRLTSSILPPPLLTHMHTGREISKGKGCWPPWWWVEARLDPPSSPRPDILIKRELQRYLHNGCACQLHGASFKDFLSLMGLRWYSDAWGIMLVEAFSGVTPGTLLVAKSGFKEDLGWVPHGFLQLRCPWESRWLQPPARAEISGLVSDRMFCWVSASSLWRLPLKWVKYHSSQDWCGGSQNRHWLAEQPALCLAHSQHSAQELGTIIVLLERQNFNKGPPTCVEDAGVVLGSRIKIAD